MLCRGEPYDVGGAGGIGRESAITRPLGSRTRKRTSLRVRASSSSTSIGFNVASRPIAAAAILACSVIERTSADSSRASYAPR